MKKVGTIDGADPAVTTRPMSFSSDMVRAILAGTKTQTRRPIAPNADAIHLISGMNVPFRAGRPMRCKFGEAGERIWVRERWSQNDSTSQQIIYAADENGDGQHRWRPSYIMPRSACRIILEITGVRVERLNDISSADARREGFPIDQPTDDPIGWFQKLWDRLSKPQQSWADNPWVWVIDFRVVQNTAATQHNRAATKPTAKSRRTQRKTRRK